MNPTEAFQAAMRHHQAGQLADAARLYADVLAAEPRNLQALVLSGALAHMAGRNEEAVDLFGRALALNEQPDFHYNIALAKWALGRRAEAITHWTRALALNPNFAQAHLNLGNALREDGRLGEAVAHLRRALQLQPSPFAHNNLGLALAALGEPEAVAHFQRAIEMHPGFVEPHLNLAIALAAQGQIAQALSHVRRSLQIEETPENKALFVRLAAALDAVADDGLRQLVTRAVTEGWERASDLAPLAATLVKHGDDIARDPLLRWLLTSGVICDLDLEQFLTAKRRAQLDAGGEAMDDDTLQLTCALARQCFINEYVYALGPDELARAERLRDRLVIDGAASEAQVAIVAAYFPLHPLPCADALLARSWSAPVAAVIDQQIRAPRQEALCRATIPRLTPIEDEVSRLVQAQYEQNPYPRWIAAELPHRYESVDALMSREHPRAPYRRRGNGKLDILIAGCGTGRHSVGVAQQFERANVLAIDLSQASLGYAKARSDALGIRNIEYGQADILQLGSIGRSFDMIQSAGVLHHLGDPWAGFRVLLSLLRPGGVMYLALYSEIARRDIVAARATIAERGFGTTSADIRACRGELMAHDTLKDVALFNDFFTVSECRDLLFHRQEHRMTLRQIREILVASGVQFLGFELGMRARQQYAARFSDKDMLDLDCWHAFEQDYPDTFASMYRFWIQKPGDWQIP